MKLAHGEVGDVDQLLRSGYRRVTHALAPSHIHAWYAATIRPFRRRVMHCQRQKSTPSARTTVRRLPRADVVIATFFGVIAGCPSSSSPRRITGLMTRRTSRCTICCWSAYGVDRRVRCCSAYGAAGHSRSRSPPGRRMLADGDISILRLWNAYARCPRCREQNSDMGVPRAAGRVPQNVVRQLREPG